MRDKAILLGAKTSRDRVGKTKNELFYIITNGYTLVILDMRTLHSIEMKNEGVDI